MERMVQYRLDDAEIQKVLVDYIAEKTGADPRVLTIGVSTSNGKMSAYTNTITLPVDTK